MISDKSLQIYQTFVEESEKKSYTLKEELDEAFRISDENEYMLEDVSIKVAHVQQVEDLVRAKEELDKFSQQQ